jgi:hypothetical protein
MLKKGEEGSSMLYKFQEKENHQTTKTKKKESFIYSTHMTIKFKRKRKAA